ncbi:META domain-containing protein [Gluconobacter morbifer]|uniref:DUF306 domain-containing protein n=1 Tax=Gluconobacter morbifer G707 TaxID=1088869 RepID=G6XG45_9PROT|nr:META domain-containing protein [Gluconobacter morbifer]EHH69153.1 hypothetical protein GMO_04600 [Gluconobacter morbifer G707]
MMMHHRLALVLLAGGLIAAPGAWADTVKILHGSVSYRERMALPPGAVLSVRLEEVRPNGETESVLAESSAPIARAIPIPYTLTYHAPPAAGAYNLQAQIVVDGKILFQNTDRHPLSQPDILVHRVSSTVPEAPYGAWRIQSLGGHSFQTLADGPGLTLQKDGTVYGTDGCNRLMGRFRLQGKQLTFLPFAMTRKACSPALMKQEQEINTVLSKVNQWSLEKNRELVLRSKGDTFGIVLIQQDPN